jgi:hypothetical protein
MIRFIAKDEKDGNGVGNDAVNVANRDVIPTKSDDEISTNVHAVAGANRDGIPAKNGDESNGQGVSHESLRPCLSLLTSFFCSFLLFRS